MTLPTLQQARDFLDRTQNGDGGWGYLVGKFSVTEPTALAVIARPSQATWEKGTAWLLHTQKDDGGWSVSSEDEESGWMTSWAVWALQSISAEESLAAARRGVEWILDMAVARTKDPITHDLIGVDPSLAGWAWQPGEGAWIEPTALSVLVLLGAGISNHLRLSEGVAFLRDRVCSGGGWNIGAPVNFGQVMPPTPYHTALTLLALRATDPDPNDPIVADGLSAMRRILTPDVAASNLAWGIIALQAWQSDAASLRDRLLERQSADGSWENSPYATASALLALQEPETISFGG